MMQQGRSLLFCLCVLIVFALYVLLDTWNTYIWLKKISLYAFWMYFNPIEYLIRYVMMQQGRSSLFCLFISIVYVLLDTWNTYIWLKK